jgi:hypothetical protein
VPFGEQQDNALASAMAETIEPTNSFFKIRVYPSWTSGA